MEDLLRVLETLTVGRFHLVGTAAGGIAALDFAVSFPERLLSLTIANSVYGIEDAAFTALRDNLRAASAQASGLRTDFLELGPAYRAVNPEGAARWLAAVRENPAARVPQPTRSRITFALLERLRMPVFLLTGDADLLSPPPLMRLVGTRIARARTSVVAESGHSAFWEQPGVFNRTVLAFLADE